MIERHAVPPLQRPPRTEFADQLRVAANDLNRHLHDRRFWVVQALVLLATAVHSWLDGLEALSGHEPPELFVVLMYALFFVPVIYASLNFGRAGAIPTAIWTAVLAAPAVVFFHHGSVRIAEAVQHLTIIALAVVISTRVDREVAARREAEREGQARRLSEAKYRALFASAGDAIVVFNADGIIEEANAAAAELFAPAHTVKLGMPLATLLGDEQAARLRALAARGGIGGEDLHLKSPSGSERWLEPVCSAVQTAGAPPAVQVVFRDVTERRSAQHGLEAYARHIVSAQEDERKRIARDLHDGSLQSIILLCRQIDRCEAHAANLFERVQQVISERQDARGHSSSDSTMDKRLATTVAETQVRLTDDIKFVHRAAEAIADELRGFSWSLRPSILDDLGLVPAVEWLVHDLEDRTGTRGDFAVHGVERRLPAELEPGVFRIAQEALHNVERHAQATQVSVALVFTDAEIRLAIDDNGRGFPIQDGQTLNLQSGNLGLLGMRERARLLGGMLRITAAPNQGTHVEVVIPGEALAGS